MQYPPFARWYENWAPTVARWALGAILLFGASSKIPGGAMFAGLAAATGAAHVPLPYLAVILAGILEAVTGLMLIVGYRARLAAVVLLPYLALLTVLFHWPNASSDQMAIGFFIVHFIYMGLLAYISVYGARHFALRRDA